MIYFIQASKSRLIKIGCTSNVRERVWDIRRSSPEDINILKIIRGSFKDETELHKKFKSLNEYSEWYSPGKDLLDFIEKLEGVPYDDSPSKIIRFEIPDELHRDIKLYCIDNNITMRSLMPELIDKGWKVVEAINDDTLYNDDGTPKIS